jgi:endonuclease/exonuclease/phosphatase family metal-dependent hydrolase
LLLGGAADAGEPLRAMTFNIRYGTAPDGDNAWPKRRDLVIGVLRREAPHVIGVQEALRFQLDELGEALPDYDEVGVGRDDGLEAGEYSAILYDRRRLDVLDQGTFWFADPPAAPGTPTWGSNFARICTWIRARDTSSGRQFYVYNLHWDHQSQESREKSADMLLERISQRAAADEPVIVMGDFNSDEQNPAYQRLLASKSHRLTDTFRRVHPDEAAVLTFHGFQGGSDGRKIDAVLVSPEWQVSAAEIVRTRRDHVFPSDHYPVTATIDLSAASQ